MRKVEVRSSRPDLLDQQDFSQPAAQASNQWGRFALSLYVSSPDLDLTIILRHPFIAAGTVIGHQLRHPQRRPTL
jgi:hypothetical protein